MAERCVIIKQERIERVMTNREIVLYALYVKGGASHVVHTEDVALCCFELASHSFSWVKYPEYPDKEVVRYALKNMREAHKDALVAGRTGKASKGKPVDGWSLTPTGVQWIKKHERRLKNELNVGLSKAHRQELLRSLQRIRNHKSFKAFSNDVERYVVCLGNVAELMRCRVDAEPTVWEKRFERARGQATSAGQDDIVKFVEACESQVIERFAHR